MLLFNLEVRILPLQYYEVNLLFDYILQALLMMLVAMLFALYMLKISVIPENKTIFDIHQIDTHLYLDQPL